jgi:hypothetical protein
MYPVIRSKTIERSKKMNMIWYAYIFWTLGAACLGFGIAAVFAGFFKLPRPVYLIPYVGLVSL